MSNSFEFTYEDVLSSLEEMYGTSDKGFSMQDLANVMGWSANWARKNLRDLISNGKAEFAGHRVADRIDGKKCRIPVYRMIKKDDNG